MRHPQTAPDFHHDLLTAFDPIGLQILQGSDQAESAGEGTHPLSPARSGLWALTRSALLTIRNLQQALAAAQAQNQIQKTRIAELEKLSTTDELTGLLNRRGFFDLFDKEMDRVNREQVSGGALVLIDLDNFKRINDTYGHCAGDAALRLVGQTLSAYCRKMDLIARLGGDEFIIMMPSGKTMTLSERAQNLARKLNSLVLKHDGHRISIRASLGVEEYSKGKSTATILKSADSRLYDQKENKEKS